MTVVIYVAVAEATNDHELIQDRKDKARKSGLCLADGEIKLVGAFFLG